MCLKLFTAPFVPQNLAFNYCGYSLCNRISKERANNLYEIVVIAISIVPLKPICSFGLGVSLHRIIDLKGQFHQLSTKSAGFIVLCQAYLAAEIALICMAHLSTEESKTPEDEAPKLPQPRIFILITKTVGLAVQVAFHPYITVAGVIAGFAISRIDFKSYINSINDPNVKKICNDIYDKSQASQACDETNKVIILSYECHSVASSVVSKFGAFSAGLSKGIDLASLFGKTPGPSPTENKGSRDSILDLD